jgi:hypothetical protein
VNGTGRAAGTADGARCSSTGAAPRSPLRRPAAFGSSFISGTQRLSNGNTLVCSGAWGTICEVTPGSNPVWNDVSPVRSSGFVQQGNVVPPNGPNAAAKLMFRAVRHPPDFAGFAGRDLTPQGRLEICPCPADTNFDDAVDVLDLVESLLSWVDCTGVCCGDSTADGQVDVADLMEAILQWGDC